MIVFLENVFPPYFWGFFGKSQKNFKVGKFDEETVFWKKNAFILLKGIFNNVLEGAKYPGGSRVSCIAEAQDLL